MAILELTDFKSYYRTEITADDPLAQSALRTGIRAVQTICQRTFDVAGVAAARTYAPRCGSGVLRIHDCTSITSVVENGSTLSVGTHYQSETREGVQTISWSGASLPYEQIRRQGGSWYTYQDTATVTVTAAWGMSAVPAEVVEATAIAAKEIYDMRDVKLGVLAVTDAGVARVRQNAMVMSLLSDWVRIEAFGIA